MNRQLADDRDPAAAGLDLEFPQLGACDWAQGPAVLAIQSLVQAGPRAS